MASEHEPKQLLHLVVGGELASTETITFKDLSKLDIMDFYPNYQETLKTWQNTTQQTINNTQMHYFIIHIHKLIEPNQNKTN